MCLGLEPSSASDCPEGVCSDVANNLAYVLAQSAAPDLSRAMQLANAALERHPSKSEYLETRQEILARLNPAGGH
jgi:hypothetical protein